MNILALLAAILPSLISLAEKIFVDKPSSGADKKALVMQATEVALTTVGAISKGGQSKTWERITPLVAQMVDVGATIAFPQEKSKLDKISPVESKIM